MTRLRLSAAAAVVTATVLAGCGSDGGSDGTAGGDGPQVVTAFYPLQFVTERIAGDRAEVTSLTKPGVEAHDLELAPQDVAKVAKADLVVYLAGFQPAVDEAVASQARDSAFDVTNAARLDVAATDDGHDGHDHGNEDADAASSSPSESDDHAHESGAAEPSAAGPDDGHDHGDEERGPGDPHFWLDPTRLADVTTAVAEHLATKDPAGATTYRANAESLVKELTTLDGELEQGLTTCTNRDLVTGHAAFAYLADRYDLHQVGIAGLSPDQEPDATTMKELTEHIAEHKVKTVYAETLVSPALAETLARETGATVKVLDPLEGLTDSSAGKDYLEVMRSNLATLRTGQGCT